MNRFLYDNIEPRPGRKALDGSLSKQTRTGMKPNKPTGYDAWAGKRLDARRRDFDARGLGSKPGYTRPGSMRRPS